MTMPRWLIPIVYLIGSLLAAEVIPRLEFRFFPAYGDQISVSTAQALLGAISSGLMALTAIVFSIAFLLIQYTATAASKRFILLVGRKSVIFHALGLFVATFTFALGTLAFVNHQGSNWVPFGSIIIVAVLLAVSMGFLAELIHQVAELRITRIVSSIGDDGRAEIARMRVARPFTGDGPPSGPASQVVVHHGGLMVLKGFDAEALVRLARDAGAVICLDYAVGDAVYGDSVVARIYGAHRPVADTELLRCVHLGPENAFAGDVHFALRLLVDTAIMALSPAVNDPTTAVQALDQIEDLLLRLGRLDFDNGRIADENGALRLVYPAATWEDYLSLAFDEIRDYGVGSLQVVRRLRAALDDLANSLSNASRRDAVVEYRRRLDAAIEPLGYDDGRRAAALAVDPQGLGLTRRRL